MNRRMQAKVSDSGRVSHFYSKAKTDINIRISNEEFG